MQKQPEEKTAAPMNVRLLALSMMFVAVGLSLCGDAFDFPVGLFMGFGLAAGIGWTR